MRNTLRLATGAAVLGVVSLAGAPAALAGSACSAYSKGCEKVVIVSDTSPRAGGTSGTVSRTSLPRTGSETTAIALAGAGALAAGTVLVVASRRRATAA